jgi:4-amino-4-deoxy-L-arabinose transferase-like glycosyltransferase
MIIKLNKNATNIDWNLYSFIFLAFALRIWGIWNVTTTDEYNEVLEALRVCSGHFNFERWFKRFYLYILSVEYGVYYAVGWAFNAFSSPMDFAEKIVRNMEPLFILGRITSAIAGACTVGLLYKIGEKFFNRRVAVIASILLTFTVFHIDLSQQAKLDSTLGLLVVFTFYYVFKLLRGEGIKKWDYALSGLFLGLALQTKINTIILIFPLTIALLFRFKIEGERYFYNLRYLLLFFILGLIVGNPPILLAPVKFVKGVLWLSNVYAAPYKANIVPNDLIGFLVYPLYYFRHMGFFISLLTIASILYAVINLNKQRSVMLSFIVLFYILMGASKNLVADYYMIPVAPIIFLLIGDASDEMMKKYISPNFLSTRKIFLVLTLIFIFSMYHPIMNTISHEISLVGKNTRYLAKDWIEENISPDSKIIMDSGKSINSFAPPIAENRENLERVLTRAKENISKGEIVHGMVDENALIYYELLLKTVPKTSYDITSTMFGLDVKTINYYISNHYKYFIISENMKKSRTNEFFATKYPEIANFYDSLDKDKRLKLIKVIKPTITNKDDTFYIYEVIT